MNLKHHAYFRADASLQADQGATDPAPPAFTLPAEITAWQILHDAAHDIASRSALRDQPTGERSMARTVDSFNAMFGEAIAANAGRMTEAQGWQFMELLKMSRGAAGNYHADDHADRVSYAALAAEAAAKAAAA